MIAVTDHGDVREVRMSRPPVNALSTELLGALREAIERAPKEGARAVVVSGGPGMFTAGLDIPLLIGLDREGIAKLWRELYGMMRALACSPIPVVAAITGHAPAGGTVIAVFCDWRVAARGDFKLGLSEVQVGIPLPPMIFKALRRQVGAREAERMAVGGLILSPEQALSAGLVDEVVDADQVVERAVAWCRNLLALPADAMLATRRLARADLAELFEGGSEEELRSVVENWWSEETQGVLKALVKRLGKSA
jgi:enoyl-CoA hydratase/carnithine racemase